MAGYAGEAVDGCGSSVAASAWTRAASNVSRVTGLETNPVMPASKQSFTSSGKAFAVRAMIGTLANRPPRRRIMRVACSPSISGMRTSMQITS